jgi:SAM-dependent methyltransferase
VHMPDETGSPWHEDAQFWTALRDGIFDAQLWENAGSEVDQLLALSQVPAGAAVLDIPCGPGRHLVPLAQRGLRVCGVDLNQSYLDEARKRAADAGVTVELVLADMRAFVRPASFDLAINLYTSFGYSSEPGDDARMLQNLRQSLRPGGRLVLELVTRETAVASGPHTHHLGESRRIVEHAQLIEGGAIIQRRWELQAPGVERSWVAWHRLYSVEQLRSLLQQAGFTRSAVYGALDGSPFSAANEAAVLVAER